MAAKRVRYHLNVAGDFYVEEGCCTMCGYPSVIAPELFGGFERDSSDARVHEHCWVKKQPSTPSEVAAMLQTMGSSEFACIRYAGSQPAILEHLRATSQELQIDEVAQSPQRRP